MWYRRFVSWIRSLFTTSSQVNARPMPRSAIPPTLPRTAPLLKPFSALDQSAPQLPPAGEFPPRHEPPTTVPLARLARPSQPLSGIPASGDGIGIGPLHITWVSHEPSQPPQPSQPTQPLTGLPLPGDVMWPEAASESADTEWGGEDDEPLAIDPGSDLGRRLIILRRLVRQRIYNEGFPPDAIPEQYQRFPGQDDLGFPFNAE